MSGWCQWITCLTQLHWSPVNQGNLYRCESKDNIWSTIGVNTIVTNIIILEAKHEMLSWSIHLFISLVIVVSPLIRWPTYLSINMSNWIDQSTKSSETEKDEDPNDHSLLFIHIYDIKKNNIICSMLQFLKKKFNRQQIPRCFLSDPMCIFSDWELNQILFTSESSGKIFLSAQLKCTKENLI